jgi:hypothetical protein
MPCVGEHGAVTDRTTVTDWIARYEHAWRSAGTDALRELFSETASYSPSPWSRPIEGIPAIQHFWDSARTGPDEGFRMESEIVAIDDPVAVVRVAVDYDDGQRWRDLWVLTLDGSGRCERFEEWPFAPYQRDGHEDDS